ncbi:MAG: orotate phosphoribosyltransferase, partial [Bacteroidota bacterium]
YIRSKAKGHGMQNLIEGALDPQGKYVVIEDLISTGMSSTRAVKALQDSGATVLGTLAIFSYGFPQAQAAFEETGTPFDTLTHMAALMQVAEEIDYLRPGEKETIQRWQAQPDQWQG